jgi:hypothetical protein
MWGGRARDVGGFFGTTSASPARSGWPWGSHAHLALATDPRHLLSPGEASQGCRKRVETLMRGSRPRLSSCWRHDTGVSRAKSIKVYGPWPSTRASHDNPSWRQQDEKASNASFSTRHIGLMCFMPVVAFVTVSPSRTRSARAASARSNAWRACSRRANRPGLFTRPAARIWHQRALDRGVSPSGSTAGVVVCWSLFN